MAINLAQFKKLSIDGIELKALSVNGIQVWKSYTNQVPLSIDTDGSVYNDGLGYKNGYRVRSGGAEAEAVVATCTGFIPVNGGDVIRISGCNFVWESGTNTAINASDSGFNNIGQIVGNSAGYGIFAIGEKYNAYSRESVVAESSGVWKWVVPPAESGVAYIRITASNGTANMGAPPPGADLIVTINEEIE